MAIFGLPVFLLLFLFSPKASWRTASLKNALFLIFVIISVVCIKVDYRWIFPAIAITGWLAYRRFKSGLNSKPDQKKHEIIDYTYANDFQINTPELNLINAEAPCESLMASDEKLGSEIIPPSIEEENSRGDEIFLAIVRSKLEEICDEEHGQSALLRKSLIDCSEYYFQLMTSSSTKASQHLFDNISSFDWDWVRWCKYAKKTGETTIPEIKSMIESASPNFMLSTLTISELKDVADKSGIATKSKMKKSELVDALCGALNIAAVQNALDDAFESYRSSQVNRCRLKMCTDMSTQISINIYRERRKQQIAYFDGSSLRPERKFRWCGNIDPLAPKRCQKFDNISLPLDESERIFPKTPCSYLMCRCEVSPSRKTPSQPAP